MKMLGMLVKKFELNLMKTNLGPARALYNLKRNRHDYQLLFRKRPRASRQDLRDGRKSGLKTEIRAVLLSFLVI